MDTMTVVGKDSSGNEVRVGMPRKTYRELESAYMKKHVQQMWWAVGILTLLVVAEVITAPTWMLVLNAINATLWLLQGVRGWLKSEERIGQAVLDTLAEQCAEENR